MVSDGPAESDGSDLISTGYLEDVLFQFSSKRRRLLLLPNHVDYTSLHFDSSIKDCWASDPFQNCYQDFNSLGEITKFDRNISDMKTPEEAVSEDYYDSSSSSQKQWTPEKENLYCTDPIFSPGEKRKKRLVYPFALVKPGGFEGDMTLKEINERLLMAPTRPVRHPVGDFACQPLVSPNGPGLSGKAVVAFKRIHTQGRGTITIIRTRG
ncbi:x-ray induced transcript 1 [Striga asiatica]|uniref:X-ray induced transcript 1 n=1 Tax=Striga asiatica TaxID=4170 RepID=A0A5A7QHL0_STRAF|nr:x-ray induced transcript 1 [Striga asiatica]